jgi:hypothetical protein
MWCSSCRADVAAELSTDNRRMLCARCQSELGIAATAAPSAPSAPDMVETERDARELLARWSAQKILEQPATISSNPKPGNGEGGKVEKPQLRFDSPRLTTPSSSFMASVKDNSALPLSNTAAGRDSLETVYSKQVTPNLNEPPVQGQPTSTSQYCGPSSEHDSAHVQDRIVRDALQKQLNRRFGWSTLAGQLFAYGGVAMLTCGTVLVMWSYFGGPPNYLPTGLLTAAVGQMLLFLGVVTLISSGMEQTVHEVSWRIDHLAEEIYHMGLALDDLENRQGNRLHSTASVHPATDDGFGRRAA